MTAAVLAAVVAGGGVLACLAVPAASRRRRGTLAGALTATLGLLGVALGLVTALDGLEPVRLGWLLPFAGATVAGDATSGLFILLTGAVAVATGVYTIGYDRHAALPTTALATLPGFVAAMLLVPLAASVTAFLAVWELMALTSLVLVLAEHRKEETRQAGLVYAVMTHLGFLAILVGLATFAAAAHSETFAGLQHAADRLPGATRTVVFLLTVVGFGSKAGLLPLHAWLPRAHPEAPSPVSALMSAAMVNLGVYGLLRVDVTLLGSGPRWWGMVLLVAGAVTAVYAVLQASVATDLKRLLAYSTSENMGLVTLAIGAALLLSASGNRPVARVAMTAALLHLVAHAAFKTLGFLTSGSVLAATGLRDLDRLGGLARPMPATTVLFGIAALGASGLPLGAGFVSEWLLLQGLIHTLPATGTMLALVMPIAVGAVALTTGLGVAAMVKAFGVGFLARPRSDEAAGAHEAPATMLAGMALPAVVCGVLAVAPGVVAPLLARVLAALPSTYGGAHVRLGLLLRLPGIAGSMSPALLAVTFGAAVLVAVAFAALGARRRPAPRSVPLWACGAATLTPRMQYTATSFAEPLQRVFDDVLRPDTDVHVSHYAESSYLLEKVSYRSRIVDAVESRLYDPVLRAIGVWARGVRRLHAGSVHAYLAYGALGLLVVLVVAR